MAYWLGLFGFLVNPKLDSFARRQGRAAGSARRVNVTATAASQANQLPAQGVIVGNLFF